MVDPCSLYATFVSCGALSTKEARELARVAAATYEQIDMLRDEGFDIAVPRTKPVYSRGAILHSDDHEVPAMPYDPRAFLEKHMYQKAFTMLSTLRGLCPHTEGSEVLALKLLPYVRRQVEIDLKSASMAAYNRIPASLMPGAEGDEFYELFDSVVERVMVETGYRVGS